MDAETLILKTTHEMEEFYEQTPPLVVATAGDIIVTPVAPVCKTVITERGNVIGNDQHEVREEDSGPVSVYFNPSDSFLYIRNGAAIGIAMSPTEEVREIYLKKMFMVPPNHEFYCPKCEVCINKVLFCTTRQQENVVPPVIEDRVIEPPVNDPDVGCAVRCSTCFSLLIQKGKEFITGLVSRVPRGLGSSGPGDLSISIDPSTLPPGPPPIIPESSKGWEILKSVVYGGLFELLASLSVVTSAASADATTLSIVALGIANLIGGLTVLGHNLKDLKASQPREEGSVTDAQVDKYYELLGKRENFFLHAFVAILSFFIFGLVAPIAYGFSFRESDDKDLKLAVVAGASLICITLLGIAKAHIQRPNTYMTYFKTVAFYVTSGVVASLLTYVAGAMMKRFVEQLGWFEPKSNFGLSLGEMSVEKSGWGSY